MWPGSGSRSPLAKPSQRKARTRSPSLWLGRCSRPELGQLTLRLAIGDEPMIKTILVPTGGSDTDLVVFETALAIAQPFRAHLEFFHVHVDPGEALRYSPHARFARGPALRNALGDLKQES